MKPRHAAALALVGWYLMAPPNKKADAPLSEWTVGHTYDSAQACQDALVKGREQAAAKLRHYDSMTDLQRRNLEHDQDAYNQELADNDSIDAAFHSACIESDDPRLKAK
jgi:hypothetical protein